MIWKTLDDTGPRFRDLQSVKPVDSVCFSKSLPVALLAQDISEEPRMPGYADFEVEPRHSPGWLQNWTPSPPLRHQNVRRALAVKQDRPADAVEPVPERGGLVGFMIHRCMRYLGFA